MGHVHHTLLQGSGTIEEDDAESLQEAEVREDWREMVPSGHCSTAALMNSQQLWLPGQDQASRYSMEWEQILEP